MKNVSRNLKKNMYKLKSYRSKNVFDLWWHSFTATHAETGSKKNFFIEYYILNPKISPSKIVLGQREDNKLYNKRPSYCMIKAGVWGKNACQIHNFYPAEEMISQQKYLDIQIGSCKLSEFMISGSVHVTEEEAANHPECLSTAGSIIWDLKLVKKISWDGIEKNCFPRKPEMYWHGQGIKTEYRGHVILNGEEYIIEQDSCNGYADKRWGTSFPDPFFTIYSNDITSSFSGEKLKDSSLVIYNQILKCTGLQKKEIVNFRLCIGNQNYIFDCNKSKIQYTSSVNKEENLLHWTITVQKKEILIDIHVYCKKDEMIHLLHESPSGQLQFEDLQSGGTGWGRLSLYCRRNKSLETIENLSFDNVVCYWK
ncbi:MAG: hypothetical protein ACRC5H_05150 [Treponemataceae bacterium]